MYNSRNYQKFSWNTWHRFHRHAPPLLAVVKLKCGYFKHSYWTQRPNYHPKLLLSKTQYGQPSRGYAMLVARVIKGALKIRYLVLGSAVGGGYTLQKKYEEWKEALPDMKWLESALPNNDQMESIRNSMAQLTDKVRGFEIDPRLKAAGESKFISMKEWFDKRLDDAYLKALEKDKDNESAKFDGGKLYALAADRPGGDAQKQADEKIEHLENQLLDMQREVVRLEKETKHLRQQLLLRQNPTHTHHKVQKSLIDMYSDVLDELSGYDSSYQTQDHLPRVVVVGDQSAGKTSVLEMIAQARIFPRGAGEMMTRAPVKVTLSEGPYHIAQFRDSDREYDLTKEKDLQELRNQVELRMKKSVLSGKTVSSEVISMTVKGPGLHRMVLVDLPGIISTVTKDMASDTAEAIRKMSRQYMENPNAIILCIQDGSVDAERSNVTDLVSQMDPQGKRTIFVLTKVDLAEESLANPDRIQKILSGNLFPMKALGYFAVVTGRGRKEDSIQSIQEYEEKFFRSSRLFKNATATGQVTTRNLSRAVADCFWKMVKETVEQQADAFKATRFNLETEWKNNFPRLRELDRNELFEKARGEILDEVVNLSEVSVKTWEELLVHKIWDKVSLNVFENIYLPAVQTGDPKMFNTTVDIKLSQWANQTLPQKSVEAGWEALRHEFTHFIESRKRTKDYDDLFDRLKQAVIDEAMSRHKWEPKANEVLRVIQLNTLADRNCRDKRAWDDAVRFLENSVKEKLNATEKLLSDQMGPGFKDRWLYWKYTSEIQDKRNAIKRELDKILNSNYKHSNMLTQDEVTTIRENLQRSGVTVDAEFIRDVWHPVYRRHFLKQSLARAYDCRRAFYLYHEGLETECNDVVLFWRIDQVLKVTANALRQQVMNREAQRLEKEIKQVLEEFSQNSEIKEKLLTGRRVTLAEELKRVKRIQEKLEEFIQALNKEKMSEKR
ncbi:dynamin-like 120 kDa protein, mitochondrial isoform X2 [Macrosteles quadrilineatus]|uniref:dynamin-like 120 kDa protein, mitochondrial isoform X2 n=1 Tax=Macrosteles quadrilineatus TaxID=74068 RepID=UPI0023E2C203|nr:dynamin-like 120 kDa protein, mitochondrial isoform X2 [Macrosteles quadrilineatus]